MTTLPSRIMERAAEAVSHAKPTLFQMAALLALVVIISVLLFFYGVELKSYARFVILAVLSIGVIGFVNSAFFLDGQQHFVTEQEQAEFRKKSVENRSRSFLASIAAIVAIAGGTFALDDKNSQTGGGIDMSAIDAMEFSFALPNFDNRMSNLLLETPMLRGPVSTRVFPVYFPATLSNGNTDSNLLSKMNRRGQNNELDAAIKSFEVFLTAAQTYVDAARKLEPEMQIRPALTDADVSRMRVLEQDARASFGAFRSDYCTYLKGADFVKVVRWASSKTNSDFVFRSSFCSASARYAAPDDPFIKNIDRIEGRRQQR